MRQLPYESSIDALVSLSLYDKSERERIEEEERMRKVFTINDLINDVCRVFECKPTDVLSGSRKYDFVICKRIIGYVAFKILGMKKTHIGKCLHLDHTTVIFYVKTVDGFLKVKEPGFMMNWKYYLINSEFVNKNDFL